MKKKVFNISVFLLLLICFFLTIRFDLLTSGFNRNNISDIVKGSENMNIRNMVVFVYLGSRLLDSLIESMVIVAGAFSVAYIWSEHD